MLTQLLKKTEKPDGSYSSSERNNRAVFLERLGSIYRDQNKTQLAVDTFRKISPLGDRQRRTRGISRSSTPIAKPRIGSPRRRQRRKRSISMPNDRNLKWCLPD